MKQVLIRKTGIVVEDVPAPALEDNSLLIETAYSLISVGTEMSNVAATRKPLWKQALEQPSRVMQVVDMVKREGVRNTITRIRGITEAAQATGYSCAGVVLQVGENVPDFQIGDRVACAGSGKANHAELVVVPKNLVVKIPDLCDLADAASVTLGAIALQGVRRADPRLGEIVVVIGLGLLGQITVQLLKASGCRVIGIDLDAHRLELAQKFQTDLTLNATADVLNQVKHFTSGHGADSVIITAASTSDAIAQQAMQLCRRKGKVVVVGAVGLGLQRSPFYEKEIDFLISTSYGPGRYDAHYELDGHDYPYGYVRWTENRNMQAYLQLIAENKMNVKAMIEREFEIDDAPQAYKELQTSATKPLGVLLKYKGDADSTRKLVTRVQLKTPAKTERLGVAIMGAGMFAQGMHLPNLQRLKNLYHLRAIVSATGNNAKNIGTQFGAEYVTTNYEEVLADPNVDLILICTRHHQHAAQAIAAARAGKAVLLEKPVALNQVELNDLVTTLGQAATPFTVGFNRRFSIYAQEIRRHTSQRINPLFMRYRMNAGFIPREHWVHGAEGGGRIVGEACHIIDLFNSFTEAKIESVSAARLKPHTTSISGEDNVSVTLRYADGSVGVLDYFAVGSKELPKENLEIHFDEKTLVLDDYKALKGYGVKVKALSSLNPDKGHFEELQLFHQVIKEGRELIPMWDWAQTTEATFKVRDL